MVSYDVLPTSAQAFISQVSKLKEHVSYLEASQHQEWRDDMANEMEALNSSKTWLVTDLPQGKTAMNANGFLKLSERKMGLWRDIKLG